jgi:phosphatidylcholine synthase
MSAPSLERPKPIRQGLAWGVHAFTATGAVVGAAALLAIGAGDLRRAALLILVALVIDSVDGSLARAARVHEVLPRFDGRRLDDMVDYLNYVVVAAVFLVGAGSLVHWGFAALPILSSAYGFSQEDAKTDDDFFLGFPSYWNVVALYLWALEVPPVTGTLLVTTLSVLVFVPIKYLYPSKLQTLGWTTNLGAAVWIAVMAFAVVWPERAAALHLVQISLVYPAWYLGLSLWLGGLRREAR